MSTRAGDMLRDLVNADGNLWVSHRRAHPAQRKHSLGVDDLMMMAYV